jgi:hypothetical protein
MNEQREKRKWWVVDEGRVEQEWGFSCAPDNPDYWWFPHAGFSACEGCQVFATREAAVEKARVLLKKQRAQIDIKLAALQHVDMADNLQERTES